MLIYTGIPLEMFKQGGIEIDHIEEDLKHVNGMHNLQMSDRKGQYRQSVREKMDKGKRLKEEEICEILEQLEEWKKDEDNKISTFIHMISKVYDQTYRNVWNIVYGKI